MYRVIHGFEDLKTGIFHNIGTEISDDEPRLQEFIDAGVVEEIPSNETSIQEEDFEKMNVKEIKEQLIARGIEFDDKAKKKDLIELLERVE